MKTTFQFGHAELVLAAADEALAERLPHRRAMSPYVDVFGHRREPQLDEMISKVLAMRTVDLDIRGRGASQSHAQDLGGNQPHDFLIVGIECTQQAEFSFAVGMTFHD